MSRTHRREPDEKRAGHYYKETGDLDHLMNLDHRDTKYGDKPPGWFKRLRRRMRRAKEKQAMRDGKEAIPKFKRTDQWDWT